MAHHVVAFLISLAVGYWLLTLAEKQSGTTKTLGQVFAWIIIVVSLLGPVCVAASAWCRHAHGGRGGYSMRHYWNRGDWQGHRMWTPGMMPGPDSGEDKGTANEKGSTDDNSNSK